MSTLTAEQALIRAADRGIHQMPVPTPFAVGRVNAYLIEDDPLTLVDPGPNTDRALAELGRQLGELGHRVEDVGLVLITHGHIDHFGLVEAVVGRSRAEVGALAQAADRITGYDREAELEDDFAVALMLRHGIPESVVLPLREVSQSFRSFGAPTRVTRPLDDGERVELAGRTLTVAHRPGHTPGDTLYVDEPGGYAFAGDHLIKHMSSTPLLSRSLADTSRRERSVVSYLESLAVTATMRLESVLPGHGDAITDHASLVEARVAAFDRRKRKIGQLLQDTPQTAYEIGQSLWGNVAVTQAYLCLSEVVGHLDLLLDESLAEEVTESERTLYRLRAEGGKE